MRVWVTGSTGFLGRRIVAALGDLGAAAVVLPRGDLLDPQARQNAVAQAGAEVLVHAAWVTIHGQYWTSDKNLDWCAATLDLLRRFAAAGGRRVVLIGTCAEYDWARPSRTPWRETRLCRPASLYGAAKLATWIATEAFARQSGLTAATARVFSPVGPGEAAPRLLPSLIRAAAAGETLAVGPAELTRDMIDVRDAGAAIAHLALSAVQGPVNIGSGHGTTLGELARRTGAQVQFAARALPPGEPLWMVAGVDRLRRATGYAPRYRLEDTIADAVAFWRAQA